MIPSSQNAGFALPLVAVVLGVLAGAADVLGGLILTARNWERRYVRYFVALGAGFMLAVAVADMVPESLRLNPHWGAWLLLAGVLSVQLVEHSFIVHFHFGEETHVAEASVDAGVGQYPFVPSPAPARLQPYSVVTGLTVHTFFGGVAIGSGFLVSPWLGWLLFVAILLHKVPEGLTVASVMVAAGKSNRAALGAAALIGVSSVLGVLILGWVPISLPIAFPLAGGVTLYVAATDLLPEVNREPGLRMSAWVFVGAGVLLLLRVLFGFAA
ncbi:MAG: ZIP family metal transporter [Terriglobales bacterium]